MHVPGDGDDVEGGEPTAVFDMFGASEDDLKRRKEAPGFPLSETMLVSILISDINLS